MRWFPWRRSKRPEWDGTHKLRYVLREQFFGSSPQEYVSGWVWKCSCGTGTGLPFWYAYTESQAAAEFKEHANLYT